MFTPIRLEEQLCQMRHTTTYRREVVGLPLAVLWNRLLRPNFIGRAVDHYFLLPVTDHTATVGRMIDDVLEQAYTKIGQYILARHQDAAGTAVLDYLAPKIFFRNLHGDRPQPPPSLSEIVDLSTEDTTAYLRLADYTQTGHQQQEEGERLADKSKRQRHDLQPISTTVECSMTPLPMALASAVDTQQTGGEAADSSHFGRPDLAGGGGPLLQCNRSSTTTPNKFDILCAPKPSHQPVVAVGKRQRRMAAVEATGNMLDMFDPQLAEGEEDMHTQILDWQRLSGDQEYFMELTKNTKVPDKYRQLAFEALTVQGAETVHQQLTDAFEEGPTPKEFVTAISTAPKQSAPGVSGCTYAMMKAWPPQAMKVAHKALSTMWITKEIPQWWKWRWLVPYINALEDAKETGRPIHRSSWDMSKAFDTVSKPAMMIAWLRLGVPQNIADWLVGLDLQGVTIVRTPLARQAWLRVNYQGFRAPG
eukprot:gene42116-biopygen5038